jgi:hypothetical protein
LAYRKKNFYQNFLSDFLQLGTNLAVFFSPLSLLAQNHSLPLANLRSRSDSLNSALPFARIPPVPYLYADILVPIFLPDADTTRQIFLPMQAIFFFLSLPVCIYLLAQNHSLRFTPLCLSLAFQCIPFCHKHFLSLLPREFFYLVGIFCLHSALSCITFYLCLTLFLHQASFLAQTFFLLYLPIPHKLLSARIPISAYLQMVTNGNYSFLPVYILACTLYR